MRILPLFLFALATSIVLLAQDLQSKSRSQQSMRPPIFNFEG